MFRSANWCSIFQLRRRCSPPSPTPILIPEEPEHSAGIGNRPNSQEVLDEGIDLSRDRGTEERIGTGRDPYSAFASRRSAGPSAAEPNQRIRSAHGARALW